MIYFRLLVLIARIKGCFLMLRILLFIFLTAISSSVYGTLAGGRPNAFSSGQTALAGVVNPANAVWIHDRFDLGAFWFFQKSTLNNRNNNPFFLPGKADLSYKVKNYFTADAGIHKRFKADIGCSTYDYSLSLAMYTVPGVTKVRTKYPVPISGTTPVYVLNKVDTVSLIFSFKWNEQHSFGISADYFQFTHQRNGYQRANNPLRSVSPGHVTNNGRDHSHGYGLTLGWRWKITKALDFGTAWTRKSYAGQYRKYRGYEPFHAKNYIPQSVGAGFNYKFTTKLAGRFEVIWINYGNLPNANNNILPNGALNLNKRGSNKSPGSGLQDATFLNFGMGYQINQMIAVGAGFSHRIKLHHCSTIISHTYTMQTIYDLLSVGVNIVYKKHDFFLVGSYGFKNRINGYMPPLLKGGRFTSERETASFSVSWGYRY